MSSDLDLLLTKKAYYKIKLTSLKSNHFAIKAYVNDILGSFIVDTGASNTCISSEATSHFGLVHKNINIMAAGAGSSNMSAQISRNNTLKIGAWKARKIKFIILDFSHINKALSQTNCSPVHGIIGADILKRGRSIIDYGKRTLYIR